MSELPPEDLSWSQGATLSEMTRNLDHDPYYPPISDDLLDLFDFDVDDPIFDLMEEEYLDSDPLNEIGAEDMLDILAAFQLDDKVQNDTGRSFNRFLEVEGVHIPKGSRSGKDLLEHEQLGGIIRLHTSEEYYDDRVYMSDENTSYVVGFRNEHVEFDIEIESKDYYKVANKYAEEVGGKGVNLGFSSFFHSVTIMILSANTDGVIEPHEGYDYAFDSTTFEVTGQSFETRQTGAAVVLNKYFVNSTICGDRRYHSKYRDLSWGEDSGRLTSFYGTAFDTEQTTRSVIVKDIAHLITRVTPKQKAAIAENVVAMSSEDLPYEYEDVPFNRDFANTLLLLEECIVKGAKRKNDVLMMPSPFRVLYPQEEPDTITDAEIRRRQGLQIMTSDYGNSTYHTWPITDDPIDVVKSRNAKYPEYYRRSYTNIQDALYDDLLKYKSVVQAHIQSALLYKINGKGGCFYDQYNRVGISWYRQRASNLTWNAVYYSFTSPGLQEEVGAWSYNNTKEVYISPTFIVSRQDIHYATVLPAKFMSLVAACAPLTSPTEHRRNIPKLVSLLGGMSNSTWMTSFRTGSNRFMTCCHISESGNIPSLIESQLYTDKHHRFADFFILSQMKSYILDRPDSTITPMFRLPIYLMSLEKDYSQMLQWHIRGEQHATKCMSKVTSAAKRHALEEDTTNHWMAVQRDFLEHILDHGASYEDFKVHMSKAPSYPTFNILYFIGLANMMKKKIQSIGAVQHAMGFSIWNMITDRHCIDYKGKTPSGIPQLKSSKVVDALGKYLSKFDNLSGAYELIVRMSSGSKLPPNYLLNHEKDAKEADREISQMYPQQRIKQALPEALTETFCGNFSTDMMTDPEKYNKHINDTIEITAKGRSVHASEDRSKFCQEQEPQMQALGMAITAQEAGSTALRSAAAMGLMNVTRLIVYPPKADCDSLLEGLPSGDVIIESAGKKSVTKMVKIQKNMTQGLGAIAGGLINDMYVDGNAVIASRIIPGLNRGVENVTSDDVKRSANVDRNFNFNKVSANFYMQPNRHLHWCMMTNNWKKFMKSERFSEFNNVAASRTGMIPQSPVFATLSVQPLLSKSIFGDLVDMYNTARSTLSWGCPPDVVEASYEGLMRTFRQKWLITDEELDSMNRWGLLPKSMAEFISGFWVRDEHALKVIFAAMSEETRDDVLSGRVPLYKLVKRIELNLSRKKPKKRTKHKWISGLNRANEVADTVYAQRYVAETMMSRHVQPLHPVLRRTAKCRFFDMMSVPTPEIDISQLERLKPLPVTCHARRARVQDRRPTSLGSTSNKSQLSIQRIRAHRFFNAAYRDRPTEEEIRIANMDSEDFRHEIAVLERTSFYQGQSFKAPAGLPLTRVYDGTIFTRPASFNFTVHLEETPEVAQPFTYRGVAVQKFRPLIWGSYTISEIRSSSARLAFGVGMVQGMRVAFYKLSGRKESIQHVSAPRSVSLLDGTFDRGITVHYLNGVDASSLSVRHHKSTTPPVMSGIVGNDDAIYNYGMYCRSNHAHGFGIYCNLFKNYNSIIPEFVRRHMPSYPKFAKNAIPIEQARMTHLLGHNSIRRLKLIHTKEPLAIVTIDMDGEEPRVVVPAAQNDELSEEDFWE